MAIQISNLSFSYPNNLILKNINLSFPNKGLIVILGQSGCGKSTFLSLLGGYLIPDEGNIKSSFKDDEQSIVFQSPLLIDYLNVKENISLPFLLEGKDIKEYENITEDILNKLNLSDFKEKYPYQLSGGEKARVSIGRALAKGNRCLILDEPTGQLDEKNTQIIYQILKELANDRLIILVTHDETNGIKLADLLYRMENQNLTLIKGKEEKNYFSKNLDNENRMILSFKNAISLNLRFLRQKKKRTLLSLLFLTFNMLLIYLGMNLSFNLDNSIHSLLNEYYAYEACTISMEEEIASSGSLHLKQKKIPSEEVISLLNLKKHYYSLDYFIPSYFDVTINQKTSSVSLYPVIEQKKERLYCGKISHSVEEVIVNQSFLEDMNLSFQEALNMTFSFRRQVLVYSKQFSKSDSISLSYDFKICGISNEKKSFNKPIIYYSYFNLLDTLKDIKLNNISNELKKDVSLFDILNDKKYDEDDIKGNHLLCQIKDPEKTNELGKKYFADKFHLNSPPLETKESIKDIISSLLQVLSVFLILNTISSTMLLFLTIYSLYEDNLRLFALIKVFTKRKQNIRKSALALQFLFLFMNCILCFFLSIFSSLIINQILHSFQFPNFLSFFSFKAFFLIFLISFCCSFFAAILPLRKIKDKDINKELEGED